MNLNGISVFLISKLLNSLDSAFLAGTTLGCVGVFHASV